MCRNGNESVVKSICVDIYVGLKEGYDGNQHNFKELEEVLQPICNEGLCVCVIPCSYIYKNGRETGAIIRLINYPRFPSNLGSIKEKAIEIAKELKNCFKQYRISIQAPDLTYMIENK